jgi:hypothetical protein
MITGRVDCGMRQFRARPRRRPRLLSSPANRGRGRARDKSVGAIWKGEEVASQGEGCDVIFPAHTA